MPLNDIEIGLNQLSNPPIIHKIVLHRFEEETVSKALHGIKDLPIKLFINCRNSKRKNDAQPKLNGSRIDQIS